MRHAAAALLMLGLLAGGAQAVQKADEQEARGMAGWAKDKVGDVMGTVREKIGSGEVQGGSGRGSGSCR
jgi:hypothetical protein